MSDEEMIAPIEKGAEKMRKKIAEAPSAPFWLLYTGIAAIIIILAVSLVVVVRKRRKEEGAK